MKLAGREKGKSFRLVVNGLIIQVERKKIKNMYLKVLPPTGGIYVSAPAGIPEETVKSFVREKEEWIRRQQDRLLARSAADTLEEPEYVSGEEIPLWGSRLPLEVRYSRKKNEVIRTGDKLLLMIKKTEPESRAEERLRVLKQWYREELSAGLPCLFDQWERIIGVKAQEWTIRDMKTRWGTCNVRQRKICLNLKLAEKAPECLEYVVVHELVHLLERSHNQVFRSYMDQYLPGWRGIKARLNGRGD